MNNPTGHSAEVELYLHIDGQRLPLTHTADTFVILAEPRELSPGPAVVEVIIKDRPNTRPIQNHAHAAGSREVPIAEIAAAKTPAKQSA